MKMNKKITASVLAMTMGAGLVGSISGTVAWYQYSTRATIQMIGLSMGVDKSLEVAVGETAPAIDSNNWKTEIKTADILAYYKTLSGNSAKTSIEFKPVTTDAAYIKDAALGTISFKGNPRQYVIDPQKWANAGEDAYLEIPLWIRSVEKSASNTMSFVQKYLGLNDVKIDNKSVTGKKDISSAVRLAFESNADNAIIAKDTSATALAGKLDLDKNGKFDRPQGYSEADDYQEGEELVYGLLEAGNPVEATTYNLSENADKAALYCVDDISSDSSKDIIKGGIDLGTTGNNPVKLTIKIWLEGWQQLDTGIVDDPATALDESKSSIWSIDDYNQSQFFVGFVLASGDAHEAA